MFAVQPDQRNICLTEKALSKLKQLRNLDDSHWGLKLADELSPCGEGFNYIVDFASSHKAEEEIFLSLGIEIYVPKESVPRLLGSIIDFEEDHVSPEQPNSLLRQGLVVKNPNAKCLCPCGCGDGVGY